jgi:hypothetical protein
MIDDDARDHDMNHHKDMNDRQPSAASRRRKRLAACRRSASGGRDCRRSARGHELRVGGRDNDLHHGRFVGSCGTRFEGAR